MGDGNGSFGAATSFANDTFGMTATAALELGDLNGDGLLDLITAGENNPDGYASVRLGDGAGSFGTAASYATEGRVSYAMSLGDLNGDGVLDVVTAGIGDSSNGSATVRLGKSVSGVAPLLEFSLETMADARQALPVFQKKLEQLAEQRGEIGAGMSRIGVATNVLQVASENFKAAESRIRDTDVASDAAELTRLGILQQSAAAVLAQANQQPALAIQLLS